MNAQLLGTAIIWLIVAVVVIVVLVYLLNWLYRRSTKETSFVRTGFFGQKVVINGGAFVIPVLHEVTPVNMNVLRLEVRRGERDALITRNRMRVDVVADFYVRVAPTRDAVSLAAQTLGRRTLEHDGIRDLLEGKFVSALRAVAAEMTMEEMHERRSEYMNAVKDAAASALSHNGLELESVALAHLDQTSMDFFDPANAFDAEGLTQLTETIEARRRQRNDVEQQTNVEIRTRNLAAERQVLEIDRDAEYARLEQEREIEMRRAVQRAELARERALREQEAEQAQIAAHQEVEKARITQERALAESRIENEEETQRREIARRHAVEEAELKTQREVEQDRIAVELALEKERIARNREQEQLEVARKSSVELAERERAIALAKKALDVTAAETTAKQAEIQAALELERSRISQDRTLDEVRIDRERALQALEIGKRKSFEEAEIEANEEVERARITTERVLEEARITLQREIGTLKVEREKAIEIAEMSRSIELSEKSKERSTVSAEAEALRAKAIEAEEKAFSAREREIANRRKMVDLIMAAKEVERESLRLTAHAEAEKRAAESLGEAQRIEAQAKADADKILAQVAKIRYEIDATGQRELNEAENVLSDASRTSRVRQKLLDKLEGIVRESVRPMEKIDGINILHVDGIGGAGANGARNVTDEVIDSALRYRVQAPMIDSLMKDIGIEGSSLERMTDVLRSARDIDSLASRRRTPPRPDEGAESEGDDADSAGS